MPTARTDSRNEPAPGQRLHHRALSGSQWRPPVSASGSLGRCASRAGAFVINIGDLLQLISNDKFVSMEHRVESKTIGPRVSVACSFTTGFVMRNNIRWALGLVWA
ncbi:unnamed protein product [Linum tenue]|uniref:Isopenicillin N synthase-like Fe(2+) 2OG dioxygenase domain-containing protein n=1 Tax=Linum tenue TaxID=586396 RepID=A0AAV0RPZ3_9ROSI|nr:unnamed protein product [Linum tenue]